MIHQTEDGPVQAMTDHYQVLGVARNASPRAIRRAYRQAALRHHPDNCHADRTAAEARFRQIVEAYRVLSDADRRRRYDFAWQQYVAAMGVDRFSADGGDAPGQEATEYFWGDAGHGPGFYRRVSRLRDEVAILVVACAIALAAAMALLPGLIATAAAWRGRSEAEVADVLVAMALAQGLYLGVLATSAAALVATRQSLRKLAEIRSFSRLLIRTGEALPRQEE